MTTKHNKTYRMKMQKKHEVYCMIDAKGDYRVFCCIRELAPLLGMRESDMPQEAWFIVKATDDGEFRDMDWDGIEHEDGHVYNTFAAMDRFLGDTVGMNRFDIYVEWEDE